jgi:hypothetical protein
MRHAAVAAAQIATDEIPPHTHTTTMKQITYEKAEQLALKNPYELSFEIDCCETEWVANNARAIASIESKRRDKTNGGEWLKGWKHEMKRASAVQAKADLVRKFISQKCVVMEGALWLNDWQLICELEEKSH